MKEVRKLIYCLCFFIIICGLTILVKHYFRPFFIILIITLICNPIVNFLACKFSINRKLGAFISILIINLIFGTVVYYLGNYIYTYGYRIINENYKFINNMITTMHTMYIKNLGFLGGTDETIPILNNDFIRRSAEYTGEGIFAYFIANIAAYFILFDKYAIVKFIKVILPPRVYRTFNEKVMNLKKVATIEVGLVLISALEIGIGFFALRIPNAFILALICGILDVLPYVGTIIVFIPLILYNIIVKRYIAVVGLIALYLFVEITRQILEAKFISKRLEVHPLATIIAMYIGIKIFGVIGVFSAMGYVIVAKEILYSDWEEYKT